jgi:membrane protein DedA with SNARE-associated domain
MPDTLFQSIIELVQSLGYMGVFYGAVLEELFYFVPSSLVQLSAGAILLGELQFSGNLIIKSMLWVGIPASIGVTIGSLPYYALGYFGGKPAIERWGKWLGVSWKSIEKFDKTLTKTWWDDFIFTGLRALPILPSVVLSVGPGVFRLPMRTYLIGSFVGTFIRATVLGFVGSRLGAGAATFSQTVERAQTIGLIIFGVSSVFVLFFWWRNKKKKTKNNSESLNQ